MNILAIDSCTEIASVTLYKSGERVSRVLSGVEKTSGHILKMCDEFSNKYKVHLLINNNTQSFKSIKKN